MKKKGNVYIKLVLSYIIIFVIPIFMSIFFYFYSCSIIEEWVGTANKNLLQTVYGICDSEVQRFKGIISQLIMDDNIQQCAKFKGETTGPEQRRLYDVSVDVFNQYNAINNGDAYCKDVFVYYKNIDKVISAHGTMDLELYGTLYSAQDDASAQTIKQYLDEYHFYGLTNLRNVWADGTEVVLMTMGVLGTNAAEAGAMVGIWIDVDSLNSKIQSVSWRDALIWTVIDEDGNAIVEPDGGIETNAYILDSVTSKDTKLTYNIMTPEELVIEPATKLRNLFMIGVFLCMFIGYVVLKGGLKMHYTPIKELLELFATHDIGENSEINNEYQYLKDKANKLLEERVDIKEEIKKGRKATRQYFLIRCLTDSLDDAQITEEQKQIYEKFMVGLNVVCLFVLRDDIQGKTEHDLQENSLEHFTLQNVLLEVLREHFFAEGVIWGEKVAIVIHLEQEEGYETVLKEKINYVQDFIQESFGFNFAALIGEPHDGLKGIHMSYLETCEVESVLNVLEEDYISYKEIRDDSVRKYYYSTEMEERILEAMRNHNAKLAIALIDKVLDVNYKEWKVATEIRKCLIYDLTATILKAAEEFDKSIENVIELRDITSSMSPKSLYAKLVKAIESICSEQGGYIEYNEGETLCLKVTDYIKHNYHDPDLNISQTAQYFSLTPAYLSKKYKEHTGKSLLKVINQIRIDEAKILLLEGRTVAEVAEMTGFRDAPTFVRAFKKYEGITPGQMRGIGKN